MEMWILPIKPLLKAGYFFVKVADGTIESVSGRPTNENPYFKGVFKDGNYGVFYPDIAQSAMYEFNHNVQITLFDGTESIDAELNEDGIRFMAYSFTCKKIDNFILKVVQSI